MFRAMLNKYITNHYKNIKLKLYKNNAAIRFNKNMQGQTTNTDLRQHKIFRLLDFNIKQNHVLVILDHSPVYRVTVTYAACVQLYPPEDEHLRLETCRRD